MGAWVIGFLLGLGGGVFVWNKALKSTGRQDNSIVIAIVAGIIIFLVVFTFLKLILGFK